MVCCILPVFLEYIPRIFPCRLPNGTLDGIWFLAGINYEWYIFDVPFRQLRMVHGTWPAGINYEWYTDMVHGTWLAEASRRCRGCVEGLGHARKNWFYDF